MSESTNAASRPVRVTSTELDYAIDLVTAERIKDGFRAVVLRDSQTIREGKERLAEVLAKPWSHCNAVAHVA
jgi:hypothetical protein